MNRSDGGMSSMGLLREKEKVLLNGPARRYRIFQAAPQDSRGMPAVCIYTLTVESHLLTLIFLEETGG